MTDITKRAQEALEHIEARINFLAGFANLEPDVVELKYTVAAADGDVRDLARAVLEQQAEIEALHIALEASGNRREAHEAKVLEQQEEIERLREVAKAAKRILLADASGRKPDVWEWKRLTDALEPLATERGSA